MRKVGMYLDAANLYHTIKRKYKSKLLYSEAAKYAEEIGQVNRKMVFAVQKNKESENLFKALKKLDFQLRVRKPIEFLTRNGLKNKDPWAVGIALQIWKDVEDDLVNTIILGSSDAVFMPLIEELKGRVRIFSIFGCCIPKEMKKAATSYVEITKGMCFENFETKRRSLSGDVGSNAIRRVTKELD